MRLKPWMRQPRPRKEGIEKSNLLDPEHLEAWSVYVDACLPPPGVPATMAQAAQALSAVKRIIAVDPSRMDM